MPPAHADADRCRERLAAAPGRAEGRARQAAVAARSSRCASRPSGSTRRCSSTGRCTSSRSAPTARCRTSRRRSAAAATGVKVDASRAEPDRPHRRQARRAAARTRVLSRAARQRVAAVLRRRPALLRERQRPEGQAGRLTANYLSPAMTAWATELEFAYDHGHLYVLDAARHWSEAEVDVRMPRSANFFVPLRVEGWGGRPPLDLDAWDHVAEFSLTVPSGKLALASGGGRRGHGRDRARRLPRALERAQPQRGGGVGAPRRERARHLPPADLAGRAGGAAGRDQALERLAARRARRPARAAGRRGPRRVRRDRAARERTGDGLRIDGPRRRRGRRSSERTIRADGVVRWVGGAAAASTASACTPSTPACCRSPTIAARSPSMAAPTIRSGSRTRCAPPTRSSPSGYIAFEDVVNALASGSSRCSRSATASSPTAPPRCCAATPRSRASTASRHGWSSPAPAAPGCPCSSSARPTSSPSASAAD